MDGNIIFHHPLPLQINGSSGSQIRPYYMYEAFKELGYHVELVTGYAHERKNAIKRIKNEISNGRKFDFVYSESSTMPTALTERHHFPVNPFLDFTFFKWLRKRSIPVGLFYRDIHWRYDLYRDSVAWYKQMVAIPFYWFDWINYYTIDHLFLPSLTMKNVLPTKWMENKVSALPPGCISNNFSEECSLTRRKDENLRLIYVGGITPPLYDLKAMVDIVSNLENVSLTVCCRASEWEEVQASYGSFNNNIQIVHVNGDELKNYYFNSDVFVLFWKPHPYLNFAVPVKVLESLGYGIPIITTDGTEAARFVLKEGLGWVISTQDEFRQILLDLQNNRNRLIDKTKYIQDIRFQHTWVERAKKVAEILKMRD